MTVTETATATATATVTVRAVPGQSSGPSPTGTTAPSPGSGSPVPNDPGWIVTYNGEYVLEKAADFDVNNPQFGRDYNRDLVITGVTGGKAYIGPDNHAALARVPDGEPDPGPERCGKIATTLGQHDVELPSPGDRFCLQTEKGYPTFFKVLSVQNSVDKPGMRIEVLGWAGQ
ncbi:hypothetical protein [Kitasatospora sp. NPDC050463]|uniref:hypothetical protein n=1 Tax=Kitasatospora sp. NPDC050463 TaxID=3155786 RepID=UPI0033E431C7